MRTYYVGITGHRPERFKYPDIVKELCENAVKTIKYQYEDQGNIIFNVGGLVGTDLWVIEYCIKHGIDYKLVLPCDANSLSQHWYDYQQNSLINAVENCTELIITGTAEDEISFEAVRNYIVDGSDFIICAWEGCLYGGTFETIKCAVEKGKIVLNVLTDLSLVSKEQFNRKRGLV